MYFICANPNCSEKSLVFENQGGNIGDLQKSSGFHHVMDWGGGSMWLCHECFEKARYHAQEIMKIINNGDVYVNSFLKNS